MGSNDLLESVNNDKEKEAWGNLSDILVDIVKSIQHHDTSILRNVNDEDDTNFKIPPCAISVFEKFIICEIIFLPLSL